MAQFYKFGNTYRVLKNNRYVEVSKETWEALQCRA